MPRNEGETHGRVGACVATRVVKTLSQMESLLTLKNADSERNLSRGRRNADRLRSNVVLVKGTEHASVLIDGLRCRRRLPARPFATTQDQSFLASLGCRFAPDQSCEFIDAARGSRDSRSVDTRSLI